MTFQTAGYGWLPDRPDARDHMLPLRASALLPRHIDLRTTSYMPAVYQQARLGSCTANAIGAAVQYDRRKLGLGPDFVPSRLAIYFGEREIEGSINWDAGAQIRDGIKFVASKGVADEQLWPYNPSQFRDKPPQSFYDEAARHQVITYARVQQSVGAMQACLASGFPFVFGFSVYQSFEYDSTTKTGMIPMPDLSTESIIGGHAVMGCGFNTRGRLLFRNSWGPIWGDGGYGWMPFEYATNPDLCSDFWMMTAVES